MVVAATLSWALLVDKLCWNFLVDKPPHHDKVSLIEVEWSRILYPVAYLGGWNNQMRNWGEGIEHDVFEMSKQKTI